MTTERKELYNERELLMLLKAGDESAFTAIYKLYSKPLLRKILRMVYDEDVAKELLQDLFMKIWEKRDQIDTSKSFRSFLYTVGVNLVYDHFRDTAKKNKLIAHLVNVAVEQYTHTEEGIIEKENLGLINAAVQQLPPQRKKVFILCRLEGKSYAEASAELNISTSTIHDHMVKANLLVRKYLMSHREVAVYVLLTVFAAQF